MGWGGVRGGMEGYRFKQLTWTPPAGVEPIRVEDGASASAA